MKDDELTEALDILDIEYWLDSEGVDYKLTRGARGEQLNIKECPCCGNSNWKVYLNRESGLGNCFVCEQKFNKWKFIASSCATVHARDVIARIKQIAKEQGWRPVKKSLVAVNLNVGELVLPESYALPIDGKGNLKYLENRNITSEVAQYFSMRFSLKGVFKYKGNDGSEAIQSYAKRVIVPIFDLNGDLVSFQGRDITGTHERKYLFPPGFAATGSHLYNGHNAMLGAEKVLVGEGVFDVAAIKIAVDGDMQLRNIVPIGTFGKHLSSGDDNSQLAKFVKLQERGLRQVTFMWDAETAALEAAIEAALKIKGLGLTARVAVLPKGKDPNEVAASVVRNAYWKAVSADTASLAKLKILAQSL
ncbi:hypothetical protein [Ferrovum sp.]|uniref:hypothetical protein n=1 Tax=Ferrovum sp. TaxID=2609467 RepID=UPI002636C40E|nr:hypothetical protein [Ferrovum sp.]